MSETMPSSVHGVGCVGRSAPFLPGKRWKTMMIVSLHVSGEIPKITAPDSGQKMSEEGGSYKTDRGLPHACPTHGTFALQSNPLNGSALGPAKY